MKRKKTTSSGSSKKKLAQSVSSPANRNPSSPQKPTSVPSPQKAPPTQQRPRSQGAVKSKLSAHKGSDDVTRSIKTEGDSSAHDMSGTASVTGQPRHLVGDSPVQDEAIGMSPPSHAPHLHTSQLQPSQSLRRYEKKKKDDMFSLEKKRRRLSSMNTTAMRRSSVSASPLTPENTQQSSTEPTRVSDKDPTTSHSKLPGAPSKGKTTREILSKKDTQHNERERVSGKGPKTVKGDSKTPRDLGVVARGGKMDAKSRRTRGSDSGSESDEEPVVRKSNTKGQRSNAQAIPKRNISSILSSESDNDNYLDSVRQTVPNSKGGAPDPPPTNAPDQPSSTLWKADGMLNSSSSSGSSDSETENVTKKRRLNNEKSVRKTASRLSGSEDDGIGKVSANSRDHTAHPDKPTASSNKKDPSVKQSKATARSSSSVKRETAAPKRPHKRQGVFSDSDSEDSETESLSFARKSSKDVSAYTVSASEDRADERTRKDGLKKGNSLQERGNPHVEHDSKTKSKDMLSAGPHRNSKFEHTNEFVNSLKRPFERDKHPSFDQQNSFEESASKKLRLVDIDFTGGKMRPPPTQNTHKASSSKLTPLKKLRIQSQKHHHGLMSSTLHHKSNKTKITNSKMNSSKSGDLVKDRVSDKPAERAVSSSLTHKPQTSSKGHSLSRSYGSSTIDPHKSPGAGHKSRKNGKNDISKKNNDSGRELFAQKDAILAAKFPQKRKLVPEHSN